MNLRPVAFMCYARFDDERDGGYLSALRAELAAEVQMQTGEEFPIFQDRRDLLWGEAWRGRVEAAIDGSVLLIPFITPSFFKSSECRRELKRFIDRETALGRDDLILPIYYVRTPLIDTEAGRASDDLAAVIAERERADWTELRFEPLDALPVRKTLARLARDAAVAFDRAGDAVIVSSSRLDDDEDWGDDGLGFVERVALSEEALPLATTALEAVAVVSTAIAGLLDESGAELERLNAAGSAASARIAAIHRLKERLREPVEELEQRIDEYLELLAKADVGITALISAVPGQTSEADIAAGKEFIISIRGLADQAYGALDTTERWAQVLPETAKLSSTLREPLRRQSTALKKLIASRTIYDGWLKLITDLGL